MAASFKKKNDYFRANNTKYSINIPRNIDSIDIFTGGFFSVVLKQHRLSISLENMLPITSIFEKSNCRKTAFEFLDIIFRYDLTQSPPTQVCDAMFWHAAAMTKSSLLFKDAHNASIYRNGSLVVYAVDTKGDPFKRVTFAVDLNEPARYLQILDDGVQKEVWDNVISNITYLGR
ncbi:MAG: hypothetical protein AABY83_14510 [Pseudomonadota bacterium]